MHSLHYGAANALACGDYDYHAQHHRRDTNATLRSHSHSLVSEYSEQDPFLPPHTPSSSPSTTSSLSAQQRDLGKLTTLWILPVVAIANLSRGMTMAPRIEKHSNITTPLPLVYHDFQPYSLLKSSQPLTLHLLQSREYRFTTPPEKCLHDPAVQSRAANIQTTLGTIVGMLSIITAGYWGQISDAFGRKTTLIANLFGMAFHDVIYILVSLPNSIFNRNAWGFLLIGPIVEGILGGLTTLHAAQNAYLADCAPPGSRSTIFAYYQGFIYISLALGPQLAAVFLRATATEAGLPVFYLGLTLNIICLCYTILILPETVTREMMHVARSSGRTDNPGPDHVPNKEKWARRIRHARYRLFSPLTMFGPHRRRGGGWDLNLTFLVIAQFTHLLSVGVVQVKFLYAQHTYSWSVEQLSYYISLLWTLRAFHLLLLLPTIVHFVRPRLPLSYSPLQQLSQNLQFDYRIAQFSILVDTSAYVLTLTAPAASQVLFVIFTSLSSFTAGVNPAINSLAVSFLQARGNEANVGQMFGAMSMLQAVAHTAQPLLFGLVYSHSVATSPKAIFALAAGLLFASVALLTLLRTNQTSPTVAASAVEDEAEGVGREDSYFNTEEQNAK